MPLPAVAVPLRAPHRSVLAGWLLLVVLAGGAAAQGMPPTIPAAPPAQETVRLATGFSPPFVLTEGSVVSGFSIELWNALARRLGVRTVLVDLGPHSDAAQLEALRSGAADAAIGAIAITAQREWSFDFSIPYYDSGLQIMVPAMPAGRSAFMATVEAIFSPAVGHLLLVGALILLALAHLVWLVERRDNPAFRRGYLRGVGDGLWGAMLIIATGEYGDRDTPRVLKRLTVAGMWLFGVVLVAQFTAAVTSSLMMQQLTPGIRGPADLPGRTIGSVPGSIAAEYLERRGLPFVPVETATEAFAAITSGKVDALVYDAPALRYWATGRGQGAVAVVGPVFHPEKYAVAVPAGSPLRKRLNAALIELIDDGTFEAIHTRWFGPPS
jgi:ABC-type amino acid transport substrate-binding protein